MPDKPRPSFLALQSNCLKSNGKLQKGHRMSSHGPSHASHAPILCGPLCSAKSTALALLMLSEKLELHLDIIRV